MKLQDLKKEIRIPRLNMAELCERIEKRLRLKQAKFEDLFLVIGNAPVSGSERLETPYGYIPTFFVKENCKNVLLSHRRYRYPSELTSPSISQTGFKN